MSSQISFESLFGIFALSGFWLNNQNIWRSFLVLQCNSDVSDADFVGKKKKYKPVLTEKCDFEKRDKWNWNAFTGCFALSNYRCRDQKHRFFLTYPTLQIWNFPLRPHSEKVSRVVWEKYVFVYRNKAIKKHLLIFRTFHFLIWASIFVFSNLFNCKSVNLR